MKKLFFVFMFVLLSWQSAYAAEVQDYRKVKCIPTYSNPCTDLADPYGTGTGDFGPGAGGIANNTGSKGNMDPADILGGVNGSLKIYNGGMQVEALQKLLVAQGFLKGVPDGKFGVGTQGAVKAFQKANKLKIDGIAGPGTLSVLLGKTQSGGSTTGGSTGSSTTGGTKTTTNTSTGSCTSTTKPFIKVVSPNASGSYQTSQKITVKWDSCNLSKNSQVNILLRIYSNNTQVAYSELSVKTLNDGSEYVSLPSSLPSTPSGLAFGKNFKISVTAVDTSNGTIEDYSDNFITLNLSVADKKILDQKNETISFVNKTNKNTLLKSYSCKEIKNTEKLFVFTGEVMDEIKNSIYRVSDVWSTVDGVSWKKEADKTEMGEGWERMVVKVGKTVYSFGGKYTPSGGNSDNKIYQSTDMIKWTDVGELPQVSHYFDRSVVYFKNKFWLLAKTTDPQTNESYFGVWSSAKGDKWQLENKSLPWDGQGSTYVYNTKNQGYDSNSLGAFVLNNKIWYLISNNQLNQDYPQVSIYSSSDGKNWNYEGLLKNASDGSNFKIGLNTNPFPLVYKNKVWIISSVPQSTGKETPVVINSSNGKDWNLVSDSNTDYKAGYYSSDVVFNGKLWKIGGLNTTKENDNTIYSSEDGVVWDKITPEFSDGYPTAIDRYLAGYATLPFTSSAKPSDLKIEREYNVSSFFTGSDEVGTTLGRWNLVASSEKDKSHNGTLAISGFSFVGNNYKSSTGKDLSTLESLSNIGLYIDGVKVGSVAKFSGPFYDSAGKALTQTVKLDKPFTLNNQDNVWLEMKADFPAPKWKNFEMRTFLNGITFKDAYTTPCLVFSDDLSSGYEMVPGRNIYWKNN